MATGPLVSHASLLSMIATAAGVVAANGKRKWTANDFLPDFAKIVIPSDEVIPGHITDLKIFLPIGSR
jgi:hypothetical protein